MSNTRLSPIRCDCPECAGREWSLAELRAHPLYPGGPCNGLTLAKISRAIGHPLRYAASPPAGAWKAGGETARVRVGEERTAWVRNTDPIALELLPINGSRIPAADGPEGGAV